MLDIRSFVVSESKAYMFKVLRQQALLYLRQRKLLYFGRCGNFKQRRRKRRSGKIRLQFVEFRCCINRSSGEGRNNLIANYHSFVVCVVCGRTGRVKASCFLVLAENSIFGKLKLKRTEKRNF